MVPYGNLQRGRIGLNRVKLSASVSESIEDMVTELGEVKEKALTELEGCNSSKEIEEVR